MIQSQQLSSQQHIYSLASLPRETPHLLFTPLPTPGPECWLHPLLGYPMCPLIGRYNKGEYRIGDVMLHLEFVCRYKEGQGQGYWCGGRRIGLPEYVEHQLRNIPEVINYNKPKNMKNEPDVHLTHHVPQPAIHLNWLISFGQIGKDFLNYLNHCYIFDQSVFYGDKLNRTTCNIPIVAYMPEGSGLCQEEVERGISVAEWRSQYMSIHLKGGAPAFSPNNMRVGVSGMKKVVTNNNNNNQKGHDKKQKGQGEKNQKKKYKQKPKEEEHEKEAKTQNVPKQQPIKPAEQIITTQDFWKEIQTDKYIQDQHYQNPKHNKNSKQEGAPGAEKHQGFIHFYTAVLLQKDHRVNYHWHIEDPNLQDMIREFIRSARSLEEFIGMYRGIFGVGGLGDELGRLLGI